MTKRKGFVGTSTLILIAAGAGVATLGVSQIESLVTTLLNNMYLLIATIIIGTGALTVIQNSGQKNPKWRQDIQGGILLVLLTVGFLFGIPYVSGVVYGTTATIDVTVENPVGDSVNIAGVNVKAEKGGPLEVIRGAKVLQQASVAGIDDPYNGEVSLNCDQERYNKQFSGQVIESGSSTNTIKIRGIKASSCTGSVDIDTDTRETFSFTAGR